MRAEPAAISKPSSRRVVVSILAVLWLGLIGLPPAGLAIVRESWMQRLDRPESRSEWEKFRGAMREQTGREGPVQRKVPKSDEPPGLVWLRDYFALACAAWLLFGSVLWGVMAFFVIGVGSQRLAAAGSSSAEDEPPGDRHHEKEDDRDAKDANQG